MNIKANDNTLDKLGIPDIDKIKDGELRNILERLGSKITKDSIENQAKESSKEIHKEIVCPEQLWFPICPIPTALCRVSPFFPLRQRELKERPFIHDMVITSSSWGEIKYTGPKLSTYDEDVLMAILALLDQAKNRQKVEVKDKTTYTYTYQGPLLPILKLMGLKSYSKRDYERVRDTLKFLVATAIEVEVYRRTARGGRKLKRAMVDNVITHYDWDENNKQLTVTINPYFYECYVNGNVTLINVIQRSQLKSPIAKALYRFIQSQRDKVWQGHYLTLAQTLNVNVEQLPKHIKASLKKAIAEAKKKGVILKGGFLKSSPDVIRLERTQKQRVIHTEVKAKLR